MAAALSSAHYAPRIRGNGLPRAVIMGLLGAVLAVIAYYNSTWSEFGHALGPWVIVVAVVIYGLPRLPASRATALCLSVAVVVFYAGIPLGYAIKWGPNGPPLRVDKIAFWVTLALLASVFLSLLWMLELREPRLQGLHVGLLVSFPLAEALVSEGSRGLGSWLVLVDLSVALAVALVLGRTLVALQTIAASAILFLLVSVPALMGVAQF